MPLLLVASSLLFPRLAGLESQTAAPPCSAAEPRTPTPGLHGAAPRRTARPRCSGVGPDESENGIRGHFQLIYFSSWENENHLSVHIYIFIPVARSDSNWSNHDMWIFMVSLWYHLALPAAQRQSHLGNWVGKIARPCSSIISQVFDIISISSIIYIHIL